MKLTERNVTAIIIITTILWGVINVLGWLGNYIIGMILGVILMLLYTILGIAKNKVVSKKLLIYPVSIWAVTWIISFFLADYYAAKFAGIMPTFTVLGFHPSFAPVVFLYWIGGMITLTLGFVFYKDEWMSEDDWDNFITKINLIKEEEKGGSLQ